MRPEPNTRVDRTGPSAALATCTASKGADWQRQSATEIQPRTLRKSKSVHEEGGDKKRRFSCGDKVTVQKCEGQWAERNGKCGAIISLDKDQVRWRVMFDNGRIAPMPEKNLQEVLAADVDESKKRDECVYERDSRLFECLTKCVAVMSHEGPVSFSVFDALAHEIAVAGKDRWSQVDREDREGIWRSVRSPVDQGQGFVPTYIRAIDAALHEMAKSLPCELNKAEFEIQMQQCIQTKLDGAQSGTEQFLYARHHLHIEHLNRGRGRTLQGTRSSATQ